MRLMGKLCGPRAAEDLLLSATMPQSTDLRQLSLVDEIVEQPSELLPAAKEQLKKWLRHPSQAGASLCGPSWRLFKGSEQLVPRRQGFVHTKNNLRGGFAGRWAGGVKEEAEEVWRAVSDPRSVAALDVAGGPRCCW